MKKLPALLVALLTALTVGTAQAQLRPEVGRPLQQASELLKAGKAREALAKAREADAIGGKSPAEQLMVDRMKAAAAQRAGDTASAAAALESVYERVGPGERGQVAEQLASSYAQARNNAKATEWLNRAVAAGNSGPSIKQLQAYLQSSGGDFNAIAKDAAAAVAAAEQAGRRPDEGELLRLADAQQRTGATGGYINTLEKLLANYPKKDYWNAYLSRLPRKAGFADRFALDVLRLRLASGTLSKTEDFMELAQLTLQAGLPAEGLRVIEQGLKSGALGTGAEAARHQRLKDLALKNLNDAKAAIAGQASSALAEKTGDSSVSVGFAMVSMGDFEGGIKLLEQGIAKGGLKRSEDAKLRLGMALLQQGKSRDRAIKTLRSVTGTDGAAEVARLWTVVAP
jgi:hypothetical protein